MSPPISFTQYDYLQHCKQQKHVLCKGIFIMFLFVSGRTFSDDDDFVN